jgi:hypothetical protein
MATPIATAVIRVAAVKAGRQSLRQVMDDLHRALRRRGVKGLIYDSYLLLPTGPDPTTGLVRYNEPCWKLTACGENYDTAGLA